MRAQKSSLCPLFSGANWKWEDFPARAKKMNENAGHSWSRSPLFCSSTHNYEINISLNQIDYNIMLY